MAGLINIGFGNVVNTNKIVTIINPDSAPAKRIVQRAKDSERIVDATQGRRTKSIILTDSEHVILSALQPETLAGRFQKDRKSTRLNSSHDRQSRMPSSA